ncbi:hypothetical protein D3C86_1792920 [compost metagenome]
MLIRAFGESSIEVETAGGVGDVPLRFRQRLAVVVYFNRGQLVLSRTDALGDSPQHLCALRASPTRPVAFVEGQACGGDSQVDVFCRSGSDLRQHRLIARVIRLENASLYRCDPFATDVQPLIVTHGKLLQVAAAPAGYSQDD